MKFLLDWRFNYFDIIGVIIASLISGHDKTAAVVFIFVWVLIVVCLERKWGRK